MISCLAASCFSSLAISAGTSGAGSSKMLLPNEGVNQSPLLGSSCELLKSRENENSLLVLELKSESEVLSAVLGGVLVLIALLPSEVLLVLSRPDDGGGGNINF